ncbi:histidine kinase [Streptomyces sp. NPDC051921]|uniref:sensor histidine kinase n=1 Tax=Streptomyces sp. NPDC051921 TaxID=3155806 RepID=UPI00343D4E3A
MIADRTTSELPATLPARGAVTPSRPLPPADLAMAAVTVLAVLAGTAFLGGRLDPAGALPLALQLGLVLLVRRRWPVLVLLFSVQTVIVFRSAGLTDAGWVWPVTAAYFTLAADDRPRRPGLPWAIGIGLVELGFAASWEAAAGNDPRGVLGSLGAEALWLALVLSVAAAYRNWHRWRAELDASLRRAAQEQDAEAGRRITEARLQIARELHDVVAHTLTVVGVQLRVVAESLDDSPEEARTALATAQHVRTQAVKDLRSLIDVLHDPTDRTAQETPLRLTPEAGVEGLRALIDRMDSSGLDIRLETTGDLSAVPAPVSLAAYRVVQESLTNTVRHARASRSTVRLCCTAEEVSIAVVDDGIGSGTGADGAVGHGVSGMRERVRALGGTFAAGPDGEKGGYVVRATIPVPGFRP